jgi:hypothetical protein
LNKNKSHNLTQNTKEEITKILEIYMPSIRFKILS